ncbi:endoglucanase [Clostridia bacterium]|nr:endoglucanase [Clostridia bacterium]
MKCKKILAGITTLAMVFASFSGLPKRTQEIEVVAAAQTGGMFDYALALQMSCYFYEAQQSGPLADWNQVTWRADACMNDEVLGGWFDAGDHIKFNVPMAYSVATLCWGLYQYGETLPADLKQRLELNCMYALDYLVACDRGNKVVAEVGPTDGMTDHKYWGSPETVEYEMERSYQTTDATIVTGTMSAALSAGYAALKKSYPTQAAVYLEKAKHYFEIADTVRSDDDYQKNIDAATGNFYKSWSPVWDELFFSSNWLYEVTKEQKYLDLATSYLPNLETENQSTELKFSWPYNWDDKLQGGIVLYAKNSGNPEYLERVKKHISWMMGRDTVATGEGVNGSSLAYLGDQWGVTRYANNGAFIANLAVDLFDLDNEADILKFTESQVNYALGDNPAKWSYVIGFGDQGWPMNIHHRGAYGDWIDGGGNNNAYITENGYSHVLYGALVGGPDKTGAYKDQTTAYEYTEVATDYNAAYTSNLMRLVSQYGGNPDPNFPPASASIPTRDEFYIECGAQQKQTFFTGFKLAAYNHTAWPARVLNTPTIRYFFDMSEVFEAGYTVNDVYTKIDYERYSNGKDSSPLTATVSPLQISEHPIQYDGNIYYVELSYPNSPSVFAPQGQEQHKLDIQFRFGLPDGSKAGSWDASNDYSYAGLANTDNATLAKTNLICLYDGDKLVYGIEPNGTVPEVDIPTPGTLPGEQQGTTTTTSSENPESKIGDVDCDNQVGKIADVVLLGKHVASKITLTGQGLINANCDARDIAINVADLQALIKYMLKQLSVLPYTV